MYKIQIVDRSYKTYKIYNSLKMNEEEIVLNNLANEKLFNGDIFDYDKKEEKIKMIFSSVRSSLTIPGVLVLGENKEYGRKGQDRFYYRCMPDDMRLPPFLVPYKLKVGFTKKPANKYIRFEFNNWDDKFPVGTIISVLGDVTKLENFYEYQLYCKSLYSSMQKFTKATMKKLRERSSEYLINDIIEKYKPDDRRKWEVYTIDPEKSKDFDDGYSIVMLGEESYLISIYIANTTVWLDIMELWEAFSERISTIYLPDRKRPMLPTVLSDSLYSLCENETRFAFTLDIYYDMGKKQILKYNFRNTMIRVKRNLRYDSDEQEMDEDYIKLKEVIINMNERYNYVSHISSSHDVIAYLMIMMNYMSAQFMKAENIGIYRAMEINNKKEFSEEIPEEIKKFLKMWHSFGSNYVKYDKISGHELLNFDAYVHITSPIRRLVDTLNLIEIQSKLGLVNKNGDINKFYEYWTSDEKFEYINTTMKSIRRVQNDCSLLEACMKDKKIVEREWCGYVFDKMVRNDGLYQYMIYIKELKLVNRIISIHVLENMSEQRFNIYVFMDEGRLKQKIRLELLINKD